MFQSSRSSLTLYSFFPTCFFDFDIWSLLQLEACCGWWKIRENDYDSICTRDKNICWLYMEVYIHTRELEVHAYRECDHASCPYQSSTLQCIISKHSNVMHDHLPSIHCDRIIHYISRHHNGLVPSGPPQMSHRTWTCHHHWWKSCRCHLRTSSAFFASLTTGGAACWPLST